MRPTEYELVINLKAAKSASTFHHLCCRVDRIGLFAAVHESAIGHLASFRCDAEFDPLSAHIGHRVAINLDLWVHAP
jgi:hypothetical protein